MIELKIHLFKTVKIQRCWVPFSRALIFCKLVHRKVLFGIFQILSELSLRTTYAILCCCQYLNIMIIFITSLSGSCSVSVGQSSMEYYNSSSISSDRLGVLGLCLRDILAEIKPEDSDRIKRLNAINQFSDYLRTVQSLRGNFSWSVAFIFVFLCQCSCCTIFWPFLHCNYKMIWCKAITMIFMI